MNNAKKTKCVESYIKDTETSSFSNDITKKIIVLENKTNLLRRITTMRKILISNGAYSEKNMETQDNKLNSLKVPDWETKIIRESWSATKKLSKELFMELDKINKIILGDDHKK